MNEGKSVPTFTPATLLPLEGSQALGRRGNVFLVWAGALAMLAPLSVFALTLIPFEMWDLSSQRLPWLGVIAAAVKLALIVLLVGCLEWSYFEPVVWPHVPKRWHITRVARVGWAFCAGTLIIGLAFHLRTGYPSLPLLALHACLVPAGWRFGYWLLKRSGVL